MFKVTGHVDELSSCVACDSCTGDIFEGAALPVFTYMTLEDLSAYFVTRIETEGLVDECGSRTLRIKECQDSSVDFKNKRVPGFSSLL